MEGLIKITEQKGQKVVSARELHKFLEVETRFDKWMIRMFEYGFTENTDYQCLVKNVQMPNGGANFMEYHHVFL
ncbi:antA/AntB antirepressor family protein [Capnocytophaga canis]|uniref:antA/AntB antirepressor family protein n=1 Tax=Capnocytophaga canis TaxID=1848903 RepID=UPI001561CE41|nr:antA/AntB antirepressor family protein [Capnocytophaga canis]